MIQGINIDYINKTEILSPVKFIGYNAFRKSTNNLSANCNQYGECACECDCRDCRACACNCNRYAECACECDCRDCRACACNRYGECDC